MIKQIAIFENEFNTLKLTFESANVINFNRELNFNLYESSQVADFSQVINMDVIFVDIDLSKKSHMDGFSVIKELLQLDNSILKKIIVLTGNNNIEENLRNKNINPKQLIIIQKPTDFIEITKSINKVLNQ